jgi:hypothetical protein
MALFSSKREEPELKMLLEDPHFQAKGASFDEQPLLKRQAPEVCGSDEAITAIKQLLTRVSELRQRLVNHLLESGSDHPELDLILEQLDGDVAELQLDIQDELEAGCVDCSAIRKALAGFFTRPKRYMTQRIGAWETLEPFAQVGRMLNEWETTTVGICSN